MVKLLLGAIKACGRLIPGSPPDFSVSLSMSAVPPPDCACPLLSGITLGRR